MVKLRRLLMPIELTDIKTIILDFFKTGVFDRLGSYGIENPDRIVPKLISLIERTVHRKYDLTKMKTSEIIDALAEEAETWAGFVIFMNEHKLLYLFFDEEK